MSDYKGAALVLEPCREPKPCLVTEATTQTDFAPRLQSARSLSAFRQRKNRKVPIRHNVVLCRQRHKIESMFGRFKDWSRIHTRYDSSVHTFMSAVRIAATVIFRLNQ